MYKDCDDEGLTDEIFREDIDEFIWNNFSEEENDRLYNLSYYEKVKIVLDKLREKGMTRYYFISYVGITNDGNTMYGSTIYQMKEEETLKEIGKRLQESVKCSNVVILNLLKLNKKEFKIFTGRK